MPTPHIHNTVHIDLGTRAYPIRIGSHMLARPESWEGVPAASQALIVSNSTVAPLYAQTVQAALQAHYGRVHVVVLPDGEAHKHWQTLEGIFATLLEHACDRATPLFALGGGVVGDMTGFAAACFMRGVPFVQVPTTLLAQVDSSVGGKTGINHPLGKNMLGAFHQPALVVCDLATLHSLPQRELAAGLAEIIKYGPIADMDFFAWLQQNMAALCARDAQALEHAVSTSVAIKAKVVAGDERESGQRAILNFGHTFAHAIEAGMGYGRWLHGEAVGAGMCMAAALSERLGLVDAGLVAALRQLVQAAGLATRGPVLDAADNAGAWLQHMRVDKKARDGQIRFVLLDGPGRATLRAVPQDLVRAVIEDGCRSSA